MRTPVEAIVEVVDHADGGPNCLLGERTDTHVASVHYRGQSSLHFAKHQLAVDLRDDCGFLGFPADQRFVLNGPTADSSLLRNHLAHWLFRGTTRYSPRTRHVVVFIRDREDPSDSTPEYKGIYLALEKISYGPARVGLAPLDNRCHGDELSGGWAWQINPRNYGVYSPNIVRDEYETVFGAGERPVLMHPDREVMTQTMRDYFVDPTTSPLSRLYRYLYENMTEPDGLESHLDVGAFVDYFLHTEMSQNTDAYRRSAYFFKDRDQPINAGPVWDFNLAYGRGANQKDWLYKPFTFWKRLVCHYKFASLVPKRWRELRATTWSDDAIRAFIRESAAPIHRELAECQNWTRTELHCANAHVGGTYQENVDALQRAVLGRAKWMDENVAKLYMHLNQSVCGPVGDLPLFNCAANGSDDGCLTDPDKYIDAVEFPEIRHPSKATSCETISRESHATSLEPPTVDPCWLSAGMNVAPSALTPFCSGYGYCDPGPGATCTCIKGKKPPMCAANATVPNATQLSPPPGSSPTSKYLTLGYIVALIGAVVACLLVYDRKVRGEAEDMASFSKARASTVGYGT